MQKVRLPNKKLAMDKDLDQFIRNLASIEDHTDGAVKLAIYQEAVSKAYSDMNRRVHYIADEFKGAKKETYRFLLKETIAKELLNQETEMFTEKFEDWHHGFCCKIIEIFTKDYLIDGKVIKPINVRPGTGQKNRFEEYTEIKAKVNELEKSAKALNLNAEQTKKYLADYFFHTFSYDHAQKLLNRSIEYLYSLYQYYNALNGDFSEEVNHFENLLDVFHKMTAVIECEKLVNEGKDCGEREKTYQSLPVCILDCVFSLQAGYRSSKKTVQRYADMYLENDVNGPGDTVSDLIRRIDEAGGAEIFSNENYLNNRQLIGGELKSSVCYELAKTLSNLNIETIEDLNDFGDQAYLRDQVISVKGIGLLGRYCFFRLCGNENVCESDVRMIKRRIE